MYPDEWAECNGKKRESIKIRIETLIEFFFDLSTLLSKKRESIKIRIETTVLV